MSVETLAQSLLEAGVLDATSVEMRVPRSRTARAFLDDLIRDGIATESSLVNQLARALSVPRFDPRERSPEPEALGLLDPKQADELGGLPVAVRGGGALLWVAMVDPTDEQLVADVGRLTGRRVKACLIGPREFSRLVQQIGAAPRPAAPPPAPPPMPAPAPMTYPGPSDPYRFAGPPPNALPQPLPYGVMPGYSNGVGGPMPSAPPGYPPSYGYPPGVPAGGFPSAPPQHAMPQSIHPYPLPPQSAPSMPGGMTPGPGPGATTGKTGPVRADVARLEEELTQAKQVVKVLAQLLVEKGLLDGDELKRRLRLERERKS